MSDKPKLYDYQEEGVRMELAMKRCINGDDMGTGKTVQSIVAIERAKATPCLVVCPAALKVNWERDKEVYEPPASHSYRFRQCDIRISSY